MQVSNPMAQIWRDNKKLILLAVGLLVLIVAFALYQSATTFRITGIDPAPSSVPTTFPTLTIHFNHTINKNGLKLSYSKSNIDSYQINGKALVFNLNRSGAASRKYDIVLEDVASNTGKHITQKRITVKLIDVDFNKLTKSQQAAAIASQDQVHYDFNSFQLNNDDELIARGLSTDNVGIVRQTLFAYAQANKQQAANATILRGSAVSSGFDRETGSTTVTCTVTMNDQTYTVATTPLDLSQANVTISDKSGKQVFSSADAGD